MMVIRRGITRTVIVTRRRAYKLPSLRRYGDGLAGLLWSVCRGILANQSEATWWRNSCDGSLCPVLHSWLGGVVNVYPRCEPWVPTAAQDRLMRDRLWVPVVSRWPAPGDDKADNFGVLGGRVVRVDYDMNYNGCPHDRSGFRNAAEDLERRAKSTREGRRRRLLARAVAG
jgi:hypothetical protein